MDPTTMINDVGFPIVCVLGLACFIYIAYKKTTEQNEKREEKLYTIISESHEINKQLTKTNSKFVAVLDCYKEDIETIKSDINDIKEKMEV